jgi:tetratricopeptide (TPR) repeat protein
MLLSALLLSAVLAPQASPQEPAQAPPPTLEAVKPAATPTQDAGEDAAIAAGLAAFRKRHFKAALAEFEKAEAASPQSAAAAFYLGYTYYKIGEPTRRMDANKQKSRDLFAKAFSLDPAFKPTWGR